MSEFTFLAYDQVCGDEKLDILRKYGNKCIMTDFAILLGGLAYSDTNKKERIGNWWTKSYDLYGGHQVIIITEDKYEFIHTANALNYWYGARPAIPYSAINKPFSKYKTGGKRALREVEYGEYPQTVVDEKNTHKLERLRRKDMLHETGKNYTIPQLDRYRRNQASCKEYEYEGKKYIRFIADLSSENKVLSDGRKIQYNKAYWLQVEPITWLVDVKAQIALAEKILFSGVAFEMRFTNNPTRDFNKTNIKQFMDDYFSKEIIPSTKTINLEKPSIPLDKDSKESKNDLDFTMNSLSEETKDPEYTFQKVKKLKF